MQQGEQSLQRHSTGSTIRSSCRFLGRSGLASSPSCTTQYWGFYQRAGYGTWSPSSPCQPPALHFSSTFAMSSSGGDAGNEDQTDLFRDSWDQVDFAFERPKKLHDIGGKAYLTAGGRLWYKRDPYILRCFNCNHSLVCAIRPLCVCFKLSCTNAQPRTLPRGKCKRLESGTITCAMHWRAPSAMKHKDDIL